jgi:hypothetical protein
MTEQVPQPLCGSAGTLCRGPRHRIKANSPESKEFTNILREESAPPRAHADVEIAEGELNHSDGSASADDGVPSGLTVPSILAFYPLQLLQQQLRAPDACQPHKAESGSRERPPANNLRCIATPVAAIEVNAHERLGSDAVPCLEARAMVLAEDNTIDLPPVSAPHGTKERANRIPVIPSFTPAESSVVSSTLQEKSAGQEERQSENGPPAESMKQEVIPRSIAAMETPAAPPSSARQIIEQLRPSLSAALQTAELPELATPIRYLKIVLTPDDLGEVEVSLKRRGGDIAIAIAASEPRTANLLLRQRKLLDDLVSSLTGDNAVATVTIACQPREAGAGFGTSESHQSYLPDSPHFGDQDPQQSFDRRGPPPDKEERATRPDGRTPVHEKLSSNGTGHRGGVVV